MFANKTPFKILHKIYISARPQPTKLWRREEATF